MSDPLSTAIAVSLLILLVLAIRAPVARLFGAKAAYALWLAPAVRLLAPPLPAWLPTELPAAPVPGSDYLLIPTGEVPLPGYGWSEWLLPAWAAGAALYLGLHYWRHRRFLSDALAKGRALDIPEVRYDVIASRSVEGPVATGLIHPLILVPEDFDHRFTPEQKRFALWHEQLHHRRGDIWASAAALIVTGLLWFNPFAHMALRAFRRDMEAACDASLIAEAGRTATGSYAETILRCAARPVPRSLCALTAIDELKGRLTMLKTEHGALRRIAGLLLAGSVAAGGLALSTPAAAVQEKAEHTKEIVKRIEIRESGGGKDVVRRDGNHERLVRVATECDGEKFEAETLGGTEEKKENVKFVLCARKGESLLPALEKAAARIEKEDDVPAERKADLLGKLRAKIAELRRAN